MSAPSRDGWHTVKLPPELVKKKPAKPKPEPKK